MLKEASSRTESIDTITTRFLDTCLIAVATNFLELISKPRNGSSRQMIGGAWTQAFAMATTTASARWDGMARPSKPKARSNGQGFTTPKRTAELASTRLNAVRDDRISSSTIAPST